MKNLKTILSLLLIVVVSISYSSDDDSSSSTDGYFFKAKINGEQFTGVIPEFGASKSGSTITITCVQGIHKFQLKANNVVGNGVGTYSNTTPSSSVILTYEDDTTVYESGDCLTSGTLTISSVENNQIKGTFSFSAGNTDDCSLSPKNITEGSFKAILAGS